MYLKIVTSIQNYIKNLKINKECLKMKINFKKANKVYGYYYYCTICNKQIDYYEHLKYDGKCELCYYC